MTIIHKITKDSPTCDLLLWRDDRKQWEIGRIAFHWVGNKEYAYTHWALIPQNPNDENSA